MDPGKPWTIVFGFSQRLYMLSRHDIVDAFSICKINVSVLVSCSQDAYTGYEFEARLHFKVHSAFSLLR